MDNLNFEAQNPPTKKVAKALIKDTGLTELVARILYRGAFHRLKELEISSSLNLKTSTIPSLCST